MKRVITLLCALALAASMPFVAFAEGEYFNYGDNGETYGDDGGDTLDPGAEGDDGTGEENPEGDGGEGNNDDGGDADVQLVVDSVNATAGETVTVPIKLTSNVSGITGFRLIVTADKLTPDAEAGIGGDLAKGFDDLLYCYGKNSVLIVYGSGNGNKDLSEKYYNKKKSDNLLEVSFVVPEGTAAKKEFNVKIEVKDIYFNESGVRTDLNCKTENGKITVTDARKTDDKNDTDTDDTGTGQTSKPSSTTKQENAKPLLILVMIVSAAGLTAVALFMFHFTHKMRDDMQELERRTRLIKESLPASGSKPSKSKKSTSLAKPSSGGDDIDDRSAGEDAFANLKKKKG